MHSEVIFISRQQHIIWSSGCCYLSFVAERSINLGSFFWISQSRLQGGGTYSFDPFQAPNKPNGVLKTLVHSSLSLPEGLNYPLYSHYEYYAKHLMDKIASICLELDFNYADLMEMIGVLFCPVICVDYDPVTPKIMDWSLILRDCLDTKALSIVFPINRYCTIACPALSNPLVLYPFSSSFPR